MQRCSYTVLTGQQYLYHQSHQPTHSGAAVCRRLRAHRPHTRLPATDTKPGLLGLKVHISQTQIIVQQPPVTSADGQQLTIVPRCNIDHDIQHAFGSVPKQKNSFCPLCYLARKPGAHTGGTLDSSRRILGLTYADIYGRTQTPSVEVLFAQIHLRWVAPRGSLDRFSMETLQGPLKPPPEAPCNPTF